MSCWIETFKIVLECEMIERIYSVKEVNTRTKHYNIIIIMIIILQNITPTYRIDPNYSTPYDVICRMLHFSFAANASKVK